VGLSRSGRFWRKVPCIYRDSSLQDHPARSLGAIPTNAPTLKRILLTNYQQNVIRVTMEFFTTTFEHDHDKNGFNIKRDIMKEMVFKKIKCVRIYCTISRYEYPSRNSNLNL